jgi:plastocyanin
MTVLLSTSFGGLALAVTPGVDIAVPKVTVVNIASAFAFVPPQSVVAQGDYVHWKNNGTFSHTTTSGNPCVANGLWNASLGAGALFERRFLEPAGTLPYFCIPHCSMPMTGTVRVTTPIVVQAVDDAGTLTLTWTGGGPTYQVFRSSTPGFVGSTPTQPDVGELGMAFSDPSALNLGAVNYYLVTNK